MSGFDRLARPYRWMEYLSFGRALERCRFRFLPRLRNVTHALVLGDGDGRFAARLLLTLPDVRVTAIDGSAAMLRALQQRCAGRQVTTLQADLSRGLPEGLQGTFDLVATHFFLDCLSTAEVDALARDVRRLVCQDACWVVSEFAVPPTGAMRWPAAVLVRSLYVAFRVLTGLRVQRLPRYAEALERNGFVHEETVTSACGLLRSELWRADASVRCALTERSHRSAS